MRRRFTITALALVLLGQRPRWTRCERHRRFLGACPRGDLAGAAFAGSRGPPAWPTAPMAVRLVVATHAPSRSIRAGRLAPGVAPSKAVGLEASPGVARMGAEIRSPLRLVAPLLISIAANVWLLADSWRPSRVANAGQQIRPVHVAPLVRRGGPRVRAALRPFLPSRGRRAEAGVRCGPAAQALEAEIQSARSQLESVLPANLLFAAGAASPEATSTFQATVDRIVGAREQTVAGNTFHCTDRACRLSMLIDGEDSNLAGRSAGQSAAHARERTSARGVERQEPGGTPGRIAARPGRRLLQSQSHRQTGGRGGGQRAGVHPRTRGIRRRRRRRMRHDPASKGIFAVLALSLAANLALIARRPPGIGSAAAPTSQVVGEPAPGQAARARVAGEPVPPPRLTPQDCATQQAAGEAALAALRRDVERHTPADAKWKHASANAALTATLAKGVAAARPDVPRDAFAVECRAAVCRLTTSDDAVLASLVATPYLRRMAGKPRWGERSVTFEALPEDTVDGLSYLRELSAQIEARGLWPPVASRRGPGGSACRCAWP